MSESRLPGKGRGILFEQRFKLILERQHDFLGLGPRIEPRVGGHVVEKDEGLLAEIADDALARQLALHEGAVGADDARGKELFRLLDQGLQHVGLERRIEPDEFLDRQLEGGVQVALGLLHRLQDGGQGHGALPGALDEGGEDFVHAVIVLDEPGDGQADVVDGQFADQAGDEEDEFAVRFLPVLDDAFEQLAHGLQLLFQSGGLAFQLGHFQGEFVPALLDLFHGCRGIRQCVCLCHTPNLALI